MVDRVFFENTMIHFFENWKYIKGQFHPFDEALSGIDGGITEVLKQFKGEIVYDKITVWGESLIYVFIWQSENSIIEINITPKKNYGSSFSRVGFNWKVLNNEVS